MQKTPVSILQEMMVQKGKVPNYHLIHDGGGTHENTFTYEVSCEGLSASGTGRCKKDAKHTAAKNMLEAIANHNALPALPASPAESPVRTPLPKPIPTPHILMPDEPFINAIGELQDVCAENGLADPVYETIDDVGPPHARVFTIQCIVSNFKELGKATTKKQAKHEAARKMYARIKELVEDTTRSSDLLQVNENSKESERSNIIALCHNKYHRRKANLGVQLADYHSKLAMNYDIELRQEMIKQLRDWEKNLIREDITKLADPFDKLSQQLRSILAPLDIEIQKIVIPIGDGKCLLSIYLTMTPEISQAQVGNDEDQLIGSAFIEIIDKLVTLLR